MYLKKIISNGFKSFADKIEVNLGDGITCIVGPNGSGKSNIVDAVRWVLGEQSVKSLRGSNSMSDVIFSGSKNRKAMNVASVELVFDNSDKYINIPYLEVSIKRRSYRDGTNEYFLNNERCRLKDITNLLLDTGMAKESFNIISQGEVDSIISSSPLERRKIIEEAAGILKYKIRKEEALRKLDRTNNNINRVNDIIYELEDRIKPLKKQRDNAIIYKENKEKFEKYDISLLAYDINDINNKINNLKDKLDKYNKDYINIETNSVNISSKIENKKNKLLKLENEYKKLNSKLIELTEDVEKINSKKLLLVEKNKNKKDIKEEEKKLLLTKEEINNNKVLLSNLKLEIDNKNKKIEDIVNYIDELNNNKSKVESNKKIIEKDYSNINLDIININNYINNINHQLENDFNLPRSCKEVINSKELSGIYNTISNVISCDDDYNKALISASLSNKNFIIVKSDIDAKRAIRFLKDNHLGRATFFPIDVIKERYVDDNTLFLIKEDDAFVGILSDLLKYDNRFSNIIKNQFGNVIICKDLDSSNNLAKKINYKYKIISLDGDVINVGGSLSGGSSIKNNSISLKMDLKKYKEKLLIKEDELKQLEDELNDNNKSLKNFDDEILKYEKDKLIILEEIKLKENNYLVISKKQDELEKVYNASKYLINDDISKEIEKVELEYTNKVIKKDNITISIKEVLENIDKVKIEIDNLLGEESLLNTNNKKIKDEINEIELDINKYDIKIDNLLERLSREYQITFEKAFIDYKLDIDYSDARVIVDDLSKKMKSIGMVSLDSIEEYEKVNERYLFLTNQKNDLENAKSSLLNIMKDMDKIIKEEFINTFNSVNLEFKKVFKTLFKGGDASLKLTDADNVLTTGIELVSSPPGKKLTTISLLSGGEKTLTAIALLFAILNIRSVPFCLFDEVEAALDDANVEMFGKYLESYKNKTQFLIITHKKKTMEFANNLYGITMQESGVSKLVSVKLKQK